MDSETENRSKEQLAYIAVVGRCCDEVKQHAENCGFDDHVVMWDSIWKTYINPDFVATLSGVVKIFFDRLSASDEFRVYKKMIDAAEKVNLDEIGKDPKKFLSAVQSMLDATNEEIDD